MRHLAMTGMDTVAMISRIFLGEAMRATPPSARICAGTRSSAITGTAPGFSAMETCSALGTSMIPPPFSIAARPVLRRSEVELPLFWDMCGYRGYLFANAKDEPTTTVACHDLFYRAFIIRAIECCSCVDDCARSPAGTNGSLLSLLTQDLRPGLTCAAAARLV